MTRIPNPIYPFVDESGNFDFSPNGSRYFILTAVVTADPIQAVDSLLAWRHTVLARTANPHIKKPRDCTHFHCSEDAQETRDGVFAIISRMAVDVYSIIVQKNKTHPSLRDGADFYERVFKGLVPYVIRRFGRERGVRVFVSQIELKRKRDAVIGGLKKALTERGAATYQLHLHPNHSHHMLQVSDYICWAVARKWERGDDRSYRLIEHLVQSEFDLFARGTTTYYQVR
jgi:hypothetical protein